MTLRILVRGGGDLASGAIARMYRAGWRVLVTELPQPRAVRRGAAFAQAVYSGQVTVEGIQAHRVEAMEAVEAALTAGEIPVMVDPGMDTQPAFKAHVVVDGRMLKQAPEEGLDLAWMVVGLGPGFTAGLNCHAVVETNRGPDLGRVIWQGQAQADTGIPESVGDYRGERVLRAPAEGILEPLAEIGAVLSEGDAAARVAGVVLRAPFDGVLRGMMMAGLAVRRGEKIGDLDPRGDAQLCWRISDKALAIGGGVLEAILAWKSGRLPDGVPQRPERWLEG